MSGASSQVAVVDGEPLHRMNARSAEAETDGDLSPVVVSDAASFEQDMVDEPSAHEHQTALLTIVGFSGEYLCTLSVGLKADARAFVEVLAQLLRANPATLSLSRGCSLLHARKRLYDQGILSAATLTATRMVEPAEHDGVQPCDACWFNRYCHFGYAKGEAVIALCEPCGGTSVVPGDRKARESDVDRRDSQESVSLKRNGEAGIPLVSNARRGGLSVLGTTELASSPSRSISETESFEYTPAGTAEAFAQLAAKRARRDASRERCLQSWHAAGCPSPATTESFDAISPLRAPPS
jgi:hypothetical protein